MIAHPISVNRLRRSVSASLKECLKDPTMVPIVPKTDIVLVLGPTGSGKSALTSFISKGLQTLQSKEVGEGSGDFIITDNNVKIGTGISSKTAFPDRVEDIQTNTNIFDFPGFGDTRGLCAEVASASVLKTLAQKARSVKIVLVVNYSSLKQGHDRTGFVNALRQIASFLRNAKKYENSLLLIATKVPRKVVKRKDQYFEVPESNIKENIGEFLKDVHNAISESQNKSDNTYDEGFAEKSKTLLRGLTMQDNQQDYLKIGLFRVPQESGPIADQEFMIRNREALRKIVFGKSTMAYPSDDDFGSSLSGTSLLEVQNLADEIVKRRTQLMETVTDEVVSVLNQISELMSDFETRIDILNIYADGINTTIASLTDVSSPRQFLKCLIDNIQRMRLDIASDVFSDLFEDVLIMENLENAADKSFGFEQAELLERLAKLPRFLQVSIFWYDFLAKLQVALSSYKVQRNVTHFRNKLYTKHTFGTGELESFLQDLAEVKIMPLCLTRLLSVPVNDAMQNDLLFLLKTKLSPEKEWVCKDYDNQWSTLSVKGHYITTSFLKHILSQGCPHKIKYLEVIALHTFFVDADLFVDHSIKAVAPPAVLSIIAQRWEVLGPRRIVMNGANGEEFTRRADDGKGWGSNGENGLNGNNGVPGGSIFAIGGDFVNIQMLSIETRGGDGGRGQDGGNGFNGKDGENGSPPGSGKGGGERITLRDINIDLILNYEDWLVLAMGTKGYEGGNGGDGGRGGFGGDPGKVVFFSTSKANNSSIVTNIKIVTGAGATGRNGVGGAAGLGGRHGDDVKFHRKYLKPFVWPGEWKEEKRTQNGQADNGVRGKSCTECPTGSPSSSNSPHQTLKEYCSYVYSFKSVALDNVNNFLYTHFLELFLKDLDENKDIMSHCDTLAFVKDLQEMDSKLCSHPEISHIVLPIYQRYVSRLAEYANVQSSENKNQEIILKLYLTAFGTIEALRRPDSFQLITDIRGFLASASQAISSFQDSRKRVDIFKFTRSQLSVLSHKINERLSFASTHIANSIEKTSSQLILLGKSLEEEVLQLQEKGAKRQRYLETKKVQIQRAKYNAKVLRIGSAVTALATILFGAGGNALVTLAGRIVDSGTFPYVKDIASAVASFVPDPQQIENAAQSLDHLIDKWNTISSKSSSDIKFVDIAELLGATIYTTRAFGLKQDIITNAEGSVKVDERNFNSTERTIQEEFDSQPSHNNVSRVVWAVDDESDDTLLVYLDDQIDAVGDHLERLHKSEATIIHLITPLLKRVLNGVTIILRQPSGRSLDVRAWQVQNTMRELKLTLHSLSSELVRTHPMKTCILILEDMLTSLISVYDQIEKYEDMQSFVAFSSHITLAKINSNPMDISNPELAEAVANLELVRRSNLVLKSYQTALHGFKQWVFPFAHIYLQQTQMPQELLRISSKDVNNRVYRAVDEIQSLKDKLALYHTMVDQYDHYIHVGNFTALAGQPIFTWDRKMYSEELSALLRGEEVAFFADVRHSPITKIGDAVKFDIVNMRIIAADKSEQMKLEELLSQMPVLMVHMGQSYYGCGSKVYVLSTASQELQFSYQRDGGGRPTVRNKVYEKLATGDMVLSPFTLWKIKLSGPEEAFEHLESFKGAVDLHLEGNVQFVRNFKCDSAEVEKYYTFDPSMSGINDLFVGNERGQDHFDN